MPKTISLGNVSKPITSAQCLEFLENPKNKINLPLNKIKSSHKTVANIVKKGAAVYGINTGFGPLCTTKISANDTSKLQDNILRSHSVGVGETVPPDIARLMLLLKIQSLSFGHSGIAPETLGRLLWHFQNDAIPHIPSQGSVGASGDLAPLAHMCLPLIGLGHVWHKGRWQKSDSILKQHKLKPLTLGPKEGLALINGTQFIAAYAVKIVERLHQLLESADIIAALSIEALLGSERPFDARLHQLRPYAGTQRVAERLRLLLKNSQMVHSHLNCERVQDPYSLRCVPQIHGASREAWLHLKNLVQVEINSVTDNPLIFEDGETISGGNFHGQPLAMALDYAGIAASEIGNVSDRRTYLLLEGRDGLPKLLMKNTGINSGFMIPQYTSAALASENKTMCFPASADSIPTSLGQEDHVSMGSISARKTFRILDNLENILAVELLCAAQAFDYRRPLKSSPILESVHALVRQYITHAEEDRVFADDLEKARELIASTVLIQAAEAGAKKQKTTMSSGKFGKMFSLD